MPSRRVVAVATFMACSRAASAQTPTVGVGEFFQTLYRPVAQDVQANGGPPLTLTSFGSAFVLTGLLIAEVTP